MTEPAAGTKGVDAAVAGAKRALRQAMKERIARLSPFARARRAERAAALAFRSPALAGARCVLAYRAMPDEIGCDPLVALLARAGVRIAFPHVTGRSRRLVLLEVASSSPLSPEFWTIDRFGIRAPDPGHPQVRAIAAREIDAAIVPGRAFDGRGARLGRGGGFYDRLLAGLRPDARRATLGFAFEEQFVGPPANGGGDRGRQAGVGGAVAAATALPEGVPTTTHDLPVAAIATDRAIRRARR